MPTPKPTLPPLDVVVTSVTHNSVDLAWSSVTSSDVSDIMYVVEFRKRNGKQPWNTAVSSLKEDKLTVKNLESETWYLFNVRAVGPDDSTLTKPLKPLSHRTKKAPVVAISKLDITCVANLLVIFHDDTGLRTMKQLEFLPLLHKWEDSPLSVLPPPLPPPPQHFSRFPRHS